VCVCVYVCVCVCVCLPACLSVCCRYTQAIALVEKAIIHHYYNEDRSARECFQQAQQLTGLIVQLSGAMGRRTKFQTFDTAQLFLSASSTLTDTATSTSTTTLSTESSSSSTTTAPRNVPNDDEVLLPQVAFTDAREGDNALTPIDQAIILGRWYAHTELILVAAPFTLLSDSLIRCLSLSLSVCLSGACDLIALICTAIIHMTKC
jgi:hypothetical protein